MLVIEAMPGFLIMQNVRDQGLSLQHDPVNNCAFHTLGVICPSTVNTFLNLPDYFREGYQVVKVSLTKSVI